MSASIAKKCRPSLPDAVVRVARLSAGISTASSAAFETYDQWIASGASIPATAQVTLIAGQAKPVPEAIDDDRTMSEKARMRVPAESACCK